MDVDEARREAQEEIRKRQSEQSMWEKQLMKQPSEFEGREK